MCTRFSLVHADIPSVVFDFHWLTH